MHSFVGVPIGAPTFIWTDQALPGTKKNPNIAVMVSKPSTFYINAGFSSRFTKADMIATWNKLGFIPVVSSLTGSCRALFAIAHSINHIRAMCLFSNSRLEHVKEVARGVDHLVLGILEAIPFYGNIILIFLTHARISRLQLRQLADETANPSNYKYKCSLYTKSGILAQKTYEKSLEEKLLKTGRFFGDINAALLLLK